MEKTILLLEESEPLRKSIMFMLTGSGFFVLPVGSIEEVLEKKKVGPVDLLIADLHSCIASGLLLLEPLIGGSADAHFPVIILHNDLTGAYAITGRVGENIRLITKPFSRDALLSAACSFLCGDGPVGRCSEM